MRLCELLGDITPADIKDIERELDSTVYQPADQIKKNRPVIDLELPTNAHFMDRIIQRKDGIAHMAGKITPQEIESLLRRARTDPKIGTAKAIDAASKDDRPTPNDVINVKDDKTKLFIPLVVVPNPEAKGGRANPDSPVAILPNGRKVPKNELVAKTIFRQIPGTKGKS